MRQCICLVVLLFLLSGCQHFERGQSQIFNGGMVPPLPCAAIDFERLFPQSVAAIEQLVRDAERLAREGVAQIVGQSRCQSLDALISLLDRLGGRLTAVLSILRVILFLHPDGAMRDAAGHGLVSVRDALFAQIFANSALYACVNMCVTGSMGPIYQVMTEQQYYAKELLRSLEMNGASLPAASSAYGRRLVDAATKLEAEYQKNMVGWSGKITVSPDDLAGLDAYRLDDVVSADGSSLVLPIDRRWYRMVKQHAATPKMRERMWLAYNNRVCDRNLVILKELIQLRQKYAELIGFPSYAHLQLSLQMAQRPAHVEQLLDKLATHSKTAYARELEELRRRMGADPAAVLSPWDTVYFSDKASKAGQIEKVSAYLPTEQTIDRILSLFQHFLGLSFIKKPAPLLWGVEVPHFEVYDEAGLLCGHLLLDLYARPGKYDKPAKITIVPRLMDHAGKNSPAVVVIIACFDHAHGDEPALLRVADVAALFHELGHAVHTFSTRMPYTYFFKINFGIDFVEAISRLFEEFLCEPYVWKELGSHYRTGASLDDGTIKRLCKGRRQLSARSISRRIGLSWLLLNCFLPGQHKDLDGLVRRMYERFLPGIAYDARVQPLCSSTHFVSRKYGPCYYAYLWSQVIASDLYALIAASGGFESRAMGRLLTEKILRYGRGRDPMALLSDFLGREPNMDAFLRRLAL